VWAALTDEFLDEYQKLSARVTEKLDCFRERVPCRQCNSAAVCMFGKVGQRHLQEWSDGLVSGEENTPMLVCVVDRTVQREQYKTEDRLSASDNVINCRPRNIIASIISRLYEISPDTV